MPLEDLLIKLKFAEKAWDDRLKMTGPGESAGKDPRQAVIDEINHQYPDYFNDLKETSIQNAIQLLKNNGYRIMKRVVVETFEQI